MASIISTKTSGGGGIAVTGDTSGIMQLASNNGTTAVTIDASQNVGIGTSSPTSKLHVNNSSAASCVLQYTNSTTGTAATDGSYTGIDLNGAMYVWNQENLPILFATNNTERMRIDSSGAVLIGSSSAAGGAVTLSRGGAGGGCILVFNKPNSGATNVILNYYGATYVGGMNMDNTSTSFLTSSDVRLKKDIVESESASEKIDNIRIVSHGWKHDDAVVDYGLIAQELYEIMPRAVTKGDENEEVETVWSVDYSKLVPMLIKAHQEQQAIITDLKARIEVLEGAQA